MKRAWTLAALVVAVAFTTAVVFAGQEQSSGVIFANSRTVKYSPLVPGVSSSVVWGDTAKGPFGGFTTTIFLSAIPIESPITILRSNR